MKKKMLLGAIITFLLVAFGLLVIYLYNQRGAIEQATYEKKLEIIYTKYPTMRAFDPAKLFAGGDITHIEDNGTYYIAFITYGSGVPIVDAKCYVVDKNDVVSIIPYVKNTKTQQDNFDIKECK